MGAQLGNEASAVELLYRRGGVGLCSLLGSPGTPSVCDHVDQIANNRVCSHGLLSIRISSWLPSPSRPVFWVVAVEPVGLCSG